MSLEHIFEAWRDEEYRESLDAETRALVPENPAGEIELTDAELAEIGGESASAVSVGTSALSVASGSPLTIISVISVLSAFSLYEHCIGRSAGNNYE